MSISATSASVGGAATRHRAAATPGRAAAVVAAALGLSLALAVALSREALPAPPMIAAAGVAGVAIVTLALVRFEAAVSLGLLLLAVVRFQPAPTDAVFAVVIAVAVLSGRFHLRRVPSVVLGLLAALLALNVISTANSIKVGTAASFFSITLYLAVFAVWLAGYVSSRRHAKQVFVWYLAAALISAVLGILAILLPIPGRSTLLFADRAQGLFKDPNVFGPFLIPPLLILIEDTVAPRLLTVSRPVKLAGVMLLALGVLFSYSRAAWLDLGVGLMVMLIVLLLRRRSARTAARMLGVLFAAGVIATVVIAATGSGGFLEERAGSHAYDSSRFGAQRAGIALGEDNPIGIGPGQVDVVLPLSTHNLYVRVFAEQGPLGLLVLLALLLVTAGFAARNAVRGGDTHGIGSAALLAAWSGLLVNSPVIDTLHWRHLWIVAALIWAGAARPTTRTLRAAGPARRSRPNGAGGGPARPRPAPPAKPMGVDPPPPQAAR